MSDKQNWKGQLQTFCTRHSCSVPIYSSRQLISTEWEIECKVEFPKRLLFTGKQERKSNDCNNDNMEVVVTKATKQKKRESESVAAQSMINKLNKMLSTHILDIKHDKHLRKLRKDHSKSKKTLDILESLFIDENVENSVFMQQLIQKNDGQWILLDDILRMPVFYESYGIFGWKEHHYQQSKIVFTEMVENYSEILEISNDKQYIRRKELFDDIYPINQIKSEQLKQSGNNFFKENKYKQAINQYLEALKFNENDYKIAMNLSLSYLKIKETENALKFANKAIRIKPTLSKPYARAAAALFEMNKIRQAIATIDIAISYTKGNTEQYIEMKNKWKNLLK